jgi:hypothetical protein
MQVLISTQSDEQQELYLPMDFNTQELVGVKQKQNNDFHTKILAPCRLEEVL